jgi:Copine
VRAKQHEPLYNILLIITDGEIHDMEATKDLVVAASHLPFSIIIVGVGDEKFKLMKELDSDDALLRDSRGAVAIRDVVQFVKFKKYIQQGPQVLAEKVLKEVPDQLVSFMMAKGIKPNPVQFARH